MEMISSGRSGQQRGEKFRKRRNNDVWWTVEQQPVATGGYFCDDKAGERVARREMRSLERLPLGSGWLAGRYPCREWQPATPTALSRCASDRLPDPGSRASINSHCLARSGHIRTTDFSPNRVFILSFFLFLIRSFLFLFFSECK